MSEDFTVVFTGLAIEAEVMKGSLEAAGIEAFLGRNHGPHHTGRRRREGARSRGR